MTSPLVLSKAGARKLIIDAQLLLHEGLSSLDIIRRLAYVQIDTLAVAERSHHTCCGCKELKILNSQNNTVLKAFQQLVKSV